MSDKPFRILLDLSDLLVETFKYVWISVSPREIKTIADLKLSLCRKINFERKAFELYLRDGLLLNEETVLVLREDDTIKVQYEDDDQTLESESDDDKNYENSSRKRNSIDYDEESLSAKRCKTTTSLLDENIEEIYENVHGTKGKKHKKPHNSLPLDNEIIYMDETEVQNSGINPKKKNKKNVMAREDNVRNISGYTNFDSFTSLATKDDFVGRNSEKYFDTIATAGSSNCSKLESPKGSVYNSNSKSDIVKDKVNEESGSKSDHVIKVDSVILEKSTNNCPKKKRKRHKKCKKVPESSLENVSNNTDSDHVFKSFTDEALNIHTERKHIIFNSPPLERTFDKEIPKITLDSENKKLNDISNNTLDEMANNIDAETANDILGVPKISTPTQSKSCVDPSLHVSVVQKEKLIHDENKSFKESTKNVKPNFLVPAQSNSRDSEFLSNPSYADFPSLNSVPEIGAHIAYKILELNDNYSPEVSEYKEGIVKAVNEENDEIEIELVKHEIKPGRIGKFENLKDGKMPLPEVKKTDIVSWRLLIEPKFLSKS